MPERNAEHATAARLDLAGTDNAFHRPVAALDQDVRLQFFDELQGGVFIKSGDEIHGLQGREYRHPIVFRIDRAISTLAESTHGGITVHGDNQTGAFRAGFGEILDMTTMQDIKNFRNCRRY